MRHLNHPNCYAGERVARLIVAVPASTFKHFKMLAEVDANFWEATHDLTPLDFAYGECPPRERVPDQTRPFKVR